MSEKIIDVEELMERVQDDKDLVLELFDIFLDDYGKRRAALGEAVQTDNYEEMGSVAHSLKGAAGNISAKPLRVIMAEIENKSKVGDMSGMTDLLEAMDREFTVLKQRMDELRNELSP